MMDDDNQKDMLAALPGLIRCPPDGMDVLQQLILMLNTILKPPPDCMDFFKQLILVFIALVKPPADQGVCLRQRILGNNIHVWEGRDLFSLFAGNRYGFFQITGETLETLLAILRTVHIHLYQRIGRPHKLSPRNRILLFVLWLRSYPSYHMLSSLFDVSVSTVQDEINICLPIFEEHFGSFVRWPTLNEWLELRGE